MKLIIVGIISGIVTGLGMGGGSLLIILLTSFLQVEQHIAQAINLIFYIPTSITALIVYLKNKKIDTTIGQKLLYSVILGASAGAFLTKYITTNHLKRYFSVFVLIVGIVDLINTMKGLMKKKGSQRTL